jgi:hypothetical protein
MLQNSRRALRVILLVCCSASFFYAQVAKKRTVSKGPRAVAVLQIAENGQAHLIPVTIMVNGQFYDASAYKAAPVPMALQPGIVYEGVKAGVPQGLFTVGGAAQTNGNWFAGGSWKTEAQIQADKEKASAETAKKNQVAVPDEELSGPPKLKRPGTAAPPPNSAPPASPSPPEKSKPAAGAEQPSKPPSDDASSASSSIEAPDRPVLRQQPVTGTTREQTKASPEDEPLKGPLQFVAAVSDADGPEPRPYIFELKSDEEKKFRDKLLAMAADEVRSRSAKISGASTPEDTAQAGRKAAGKGTARAADRNVRPTRAPEFHDVQMRAFDVSNTNQAVLVLTASANLTGDDKQYLVAVVAREDIYGDLHKLFTQSTDNKHLDILPRYDFIDGVDADGDGRGELLFREIWDSGTAFAVYRVLGDRLWPLFEGKPGS